MQSICELALREITWAPVMFITGVPAASWCAGGHTVSFSGTPTLEWVGEYLVNEMSLYDSRVPVPAHRPLTDGPLKLKGERADVLRNLTVQLVCLRRAGHTAHCNMCPIEVQGREAKNAKNKRSSAAAAQFVCLRRFLEPGTGPVRLGQPAQAHTVSTCSMPGDRSPPNRDSSRKDCWYPAAFGPCGSQPSSGASARPGALP